MIRQRLAISTMKNQMAVFIFMAVSMFGYVSMAKDSGTYYRAVYISNTKQAQEQQVIHHLQQYLQDCSKNSNCNYVVENDENRVQIYNTRREIPAEEELLGIWMKMPIQYQYKVFKRKLNWHDARQQCQLHGGDLASVTSKGEEEKIKGHLSGFPSHELFWIGLNDIEEEGKYVWCDGSDYNYINWRSGEPNGFESEDCMVVQPPLLWFDAPCQNLFYFVCKNRVY